VGKHLPISWSPLCNKAGILKKGQEKAKNFTLEKEKKETKERTSGSGEASQLKNGMVLTGGGTGGKENRVEALATTRKGGSSISCTNNESKKKVQGETSRKIFTGKSLGRHMKKKRRKTKDGLIQENLSRKRER